MNQVITKILFSFIAILGFSLNSSAQKFYEVEEVKDAEVKFYFVDNPDEAELWFSIIYEPEKIIKPGIMMEVETPKEADIKLIFVDDPKDADIKVWLVDNPEEVKWINESKKKLLSVGGLK